MAQYELTARGNIYIGNGFTIPKGESFTINIPGFGANRNEVFLKDNLNSVLNQLRAQGLELPPNKLTNASFLATRIR